MKRAVLLLAATLSISFNACTSRNKVIAIKSPYASRDGAYIAPLARLSRDTTVSADEYDDTEYPRIDDDFVIIPNDPGNPPNPARDQQGLAAAQWLKAKADSLAAAEIPGNHKIDALDGFPHVLSCLSQKFSTAQFKVSGKLSVGDSEDGDVRVSSSVTITDNRGRSSYFMNGKAW